MDKSMGILFMVAYHLKNNLYFLLLTNNEKFGNKKTIFNYVIQIYALFESAFYEKLDDENMKLDKTYYCPIRTFLPILNNNLTIIIETFIFMKILCESKNKLKDKIKFKIIDFRTCEDDKDGNCLAKFWFKFKSTEKDSNKKKKRSYESKNAKKINIYCGKHK